MSIFSYPNLSKRKNRLTLYGLVLLEVVAISFVIPSSSSTGEIPPPPVIHDTYPLGTWFNFPASNICGTGNLTNSVCELLGNQSYRGVLTFGVGEAGVSVEFTVGCVTQSNTAGAALQLQVANVTGGGPLNPTSWTNVGTTLPFDGTYPCPNFDQLGPANIPGFNGEISFVFRIVGLNGGGLGDNPQLTSVAVNVFQNEAGVAITRVTTVSSTTLGVAVSTTFPVLSSTAFTISWIATNTTITEGGTSTCTIAQFGVTCTTSPITFPIRFLAAPAVVTSIKIPAPPQIPQAITILYLLRTQSVTV